MSVPKPSKDVELRDRAERETDAVKQGLNRIPVATLHVRFEFGEHHLDQTGIWTISRQIQYRAASSLNQRSDGHLAA